jgi:hypothetical protein
MDFSTPPQKGENNAIIFAKQRFYLTKNSIKD